MSSSSNGHAPSTGPQILETVAQLARRLDDKFVREQQRDDATGQILLELRTLVGAIRQLELVVRSEQEHTRRALLLHFGSQGLEKERGA